MYEESALSLMQKLPETKEQISRYASIIKANLLNGDTEFMPAFLQIKALSQLFQQLEKDILLKDLLLEETEKHGTKKVELSTATLQIKEVGVKYDFSGCNDSELEHINKDLKELTAEKKGRETLLKAINPEKEFYDGDGVQLFPPSKTSTTSVTITLK